MKTKLILTLLGFTVLAACDTGPNGFGTAPAGVSQEVYDDAIAAQRQARQDFYRGPRTSR